MRKLPPLSALRAFEAAARIGHFGKAADELCVTHSAISHQIRSLEKTLGTSLFEKRGRMQYLTNAGLRLLYSVQQALDLMAEACGDIVQDDMRGTLKISVPVELAHRFFMRVIGDFTQRYPGITVHLLAHDSDSHQVSAASDINVVYSMGDTDWSRYWVVPFRAIEFFPVCHPALIEGENGLRHMNDLARFPLIHDDADGKTWATWLGAFAPDLPTPQRNIHVSHCGLAIEAALQKTGLCLGDVLTAGEDLKHGRLIRPFKGAVPSPGNYYLVAERRKRDDWRLLSFMRLASLAQYLYELDSPIF